MTEAVADFGRRNPTAFLGSAMLAGFALARFATASQPRPQPDHGGDYDYGGDSRSTGMGNSGIAGRRPEQQSNLTSPAVGSQVGPAAASGPAGTATKNHETSTGQTGHAGGSTPGGLSPTDRRGNDPLELTDGMRRDEDDDANGPAHGARPVPGAATDRKETDR